MAGIKGGYMKIHFEGRVHKPGCLYAVAFSLAIMITEVCFVVNSDTKLSKSSPAAIAISCSFLVFFLIFSFIGKKLFDLTEKIFLKTSEPYKANQRAVLMELLVFFGSFALELFIVTKII